MTIFDKIIGYGYDFFDAFVIGSDKIESNIDRIRNTKYPLFIQFFSKFCLFYKGYLVIDHHVEKMINQQNETNTNTISDQLFLKYKKGESKNIKFYDWSNKFDEDDNFNKNLFFISEELSLSSNSSNSSSSSSSKNNMLTNENENENMDIDNENMIIIDKPVNKDGVYDVEEQILKNEFYGLSIFDRLALWVSIMVKEYNTEISNRVLNILMGEIKNLKQIFRTNSKQTFMDEDILTF